jgi:hypothetical protein
MKKISNLTTYAQTLKDFTDVVESQRPFDNPLVDDLNLFPHEWWDFIGIGA